MVATVVSLFPNVPTLPVRSAQSPSPFPRPAPQSTKRAIDEAHANTLGHAVSVLFKFGTLQGPCARLFAQMELEAGRLTYLTRVARLLPSVVSQLSRRKGFIHIYTSVWLWSSSRTACGGEGAWGIRDPRTRTMTSTSWRIRSLSGTACLRGSHGISDGRIGQNTATRTIWPKR